MNSPALKAISVVAWSTLLGGIILFFFVAICAPETRLVGSPRERDERIHSLESSSELREVQGSASALLELGYLTSTTAMLLCRVFLGALSLSVIGSIVTLRQVSRIKRESNDRPLG